MPLLPLVGDNSWLKMKKRSSRLLHTLTLTRERASLIWKRKKEKKEINRQMTKNEFHAKRLGWHSARLFFPCFKWNGESRDDTDLICGPWYWSRFLLRPRPSRLRHNCSKRMMSMVTETSMAWHGTWPWIDSKMMQDWFTYPTSLLTFFSFSSSRAELNQQQHLSVDSAFGKKNERLQINYWWFA